MAQAVTTDSQLRLLLDMGADENGKPVVKSKSFNNVKTTATADQLLAVAQGISALQIHPLKGIERNDKQTIGE